MKFELDCVSSNFVTYGHFLTCSAVGTVTRLSAA